MLETIRTGDFVNAARIGRIALILGSLYLATIALLLATSDGALDYAGRPLGTDFSGVYAAGQLVLEGEAAAALDPAVHLAKQQEKFGAEAPLYGWHYPPFFLFIAAAVAVLPYAAAYIAWQAATLPAYLHVVSKIFPGRGALLAAAAFPAAFINITHGQNGFLTAALFGGAMILLDRRPLLAGVLIGLLAYKPQFGFLIPIVLIATARWRVFAAAAATVAALVLASTLAFGAEIWPAFLDNMRFTNRAIVEDGGPGWAKMQSLYAALRAVGVDLDLAFAAQGALALAVAAALITIWRSHAAPETKKAALIVGSLLSTPYLLDYDFLALAPAIAFIAAAGRKSAFLPYEKTALAFAALAPLAARQIAMAAFIPIGFLSLAAFAAVILARARTEAARRPITDLPDSVAPAAASS